MLLRLGELVSEAEGAAAFARRAAAALDGRLPAKAETTYDAAALTLMSRVFARDAAATVADRGLRWVSGAAEPGASVALAAALPLEAVRAAQAGLLADMDALATAIYARFAD